MLREIGRTIDQAPGNAVDIEGVGYFRIADTQHQKADGTTAPWRRIAFVARRTAEKPAAKSRHPDSKAGNGQK